MRPMHSAPPLEIFRAGRHQAMDGSVLAFTDADLAASAKAYDPALHEAPLTVGHPANNGPAYGWVKSIAAQKGLLTAAPHQVDPEFAELVNSGRFKKISASFYLPNAPSNPVPGVYYLRHVGFLGAQPPAVKGLRDAAFADDSADTVTVEFADYECRLQADLWSALREWLIAEFGLDKANAAIDRFSVDALRQIAAQPDPEDAAVPVGPAGFSEPTPAGRPPMTDKTAEFAEREAKLAADTQALEAQRAEFAEREKSVKEAADALAAKQAEIAQRETALREQEENTRRQALADFADGLFKAGKLLPVQRDFAVQFMQALPAEQTAEFGEGEDRKPQPLVDAFKAFLEQLPVQVQFGEHAPADAAGIAEDASFAAPSQYSIDPARLALHQRAVAHQKLNPGTDYVTAVKAVSVN
jgi:hypothetical protein